MKAGDRVACRVLEGGRPKLGPYTLVRTQPRDDGVEVWELQDDYEPSRSVHTTCPVHMMVQLTPEEDLDWRVRDAQVRVEIAIRTGCPWPVPRAIRETT